MKDFNKILNQNKEIEGIESANFKYGEYDWSIKACVKKLEADGDLGLNYHLHCEADDETDFPLFVNMKFFILNKDKDPRKDFAICN